MKKAFQLFAVFLLLLSAAQTAQATTITFDDFDTAGSFKTLASGYAGFDWSQLGVANSQFYRQPTGYINGVLSAPNTAFNLSGNMASMSSASPFTLNSAYFTSAWLTPNTVTVTGYQGSVMLNQAVFTLTSTTSPVLQVFDFVNVDRVTFSTFTTPGSQWQSQFAMDNLVINETPAPTPIPGAVWLLGSGIACLAGLRKRRAKA